MSKELLEACYDNNIRQIKKSLKKPFDIRYRNEYNEMCLSWACYNNNTNLVNLLLENGANIDNNTKEGYCNFLLKARL